VRERLKVRSKTQHHLNRLDFSTHTIFRYVIHRETVFIRIHKSIRSSVFTQHTTQAPTSENRLQCKHKTKKMGSNRTVCKITCS